MDKNLLKRATEDTPDPTPGYMYRDIAAWTFLDQTTQAKLVAYLMDKMKPNVSNNILWKVLRIIKNLCETGHADFQKEMQRNADTIKQFASYRGNQDPKYGDKLNEKVRVAAREAMEAIFSKRRDAKVQITNGHGSDASGQFQGAPTTSTFTTGHSVSGSGGGSSTVPGANEHMAPMPTTNKWAEHMARGGQSESQILKDVQAAVRTGFGLWQEPIKTKEERLQEQTTQFGDFKAVELPLSGFGGGGSGAGNSGGGAGEWKFTEEQSGAGAAMGAGGEAKLLTAFQREAERIASFKSTPQRVDLTTFVETCKDIADRQGCDYEELAEALDARLAQKHPWQQRLNVLTALEALLRAGLSSSIDSYFKENPEDIQRNLHVVQSSLKEKASKVLRLLGVPERAGGASQQEAQQSTSFGGDNLWGAGIASTSAAAATTASSGSDALDFGGMTVKSTGGRKGGSGAASTAKDASGKALPAEDKTKLRKRATMQAAQDDDESTGAHAPAFGFTSAPSNNGAASGFGDWSAPSDTSNGGGSGWGSWDAPPQQQPQYQQQAPQAAWGAPSPSAPAKGDDFDAFFSSSQPSSAPPMTAASGFNAPPPAAPAVAPPTVAAVAPTAPPPAAALLAQQQQAMMMMQQQMNALMAQMASPGAAQDPALAAQFQMMMQQQQAMMAMMMQASAAAAAAAPASAAPRSGPAAALQPEPVVVPHGHFNSPFVQQPAAHSSFSDVQEEMKRKLMAGQ